MLLNIGSDVIVHIGKVWELPGHATEPPRALKVSAPEGLLI